MRTRPRYGCLMAMTMCLGVVLLAALVLPVITTSYAQGNQSPSSVTSGEHAKITRSNWRQHPQIAAVLAVVHSVNDAWAKGELKTSQRNFENCAGSFTEFRRISRDGNGIVRRYEFAYSAEDDSRTDEFYYDDSGRLRFVIINGWNASDGVPARHRVYLDESGNRLWEDSKGKGLYWPKRWEEKQLHKTDAAQDFANNTRCTSEVKPKRRTR